MTYYYGYIRGHECHMQRYIKSVYINLDLKITLYKGSWLIHLYETYQNYEQDFLLC